MAKQPNVTLEDFIKKYEASKKKKRKTYSQYVKEQGDTSETRYAETLNEAQKEYDRARSGYGSTGEALSRRSLNGSGYASYLDSNAYSEFQNTKREAEKARNAAEIKNRSAYARYLEDEDEKANRLFGDTVSDIYRYGSEDRDASYKLALASGLDEEIAKEAAEIGIALAKREEPTVEEPQKNPTSVSTRRVLLEELIARRYSDEKAYAYLKACGIDDEEAKIMVESVNKIRSYYGNSSSGSGYFN